MPRNKNFYDSAMQAELNATASGPRPEVHERIVREVRAAETMLGYGLCPNGCLCVLVPATEEESKPRSRAITRSLHLPPASAKSLGRATRFNNYKHAATLESTAQHVLICRSCGFRLTVADRLASVQSVVI